MARSARLGLTPALGREMARFTGGERSPQSIRDLLRGVEVMAVAVAALITVGVAAAAQPLASHRLQVGKIPVPVVAQAVSIMGLVVALRLAEGVYRSSSTGLQKQVLFNSVAAVVNGNRPLAGVPWPC